MRTPPSQYRTYTDAGSALRVVLTTWLQETRVLSQAAVDLQNNYKSSGRLRLTKGSWVTMASRKRTPLWDDSLSDEASTFTLTAGQEREVVCDLLTTLHASRLILLETLWEEYLQNLVFELEHKKPELFTPFVEKEFMSQIVHEVLVGSLLTVDEIKDEVASRFSAGITRLPWKEQWKHLCRLGFGLKDASEEGFYQALTEYFEIRNCLVHRNGRPSRTLKEINAYWNGKQVVVVRPDHLQFYREAFFQCLFHIESRIEGYFDAQRPPDPSGVTFRPRKAASRG